jgi:hypothetical protein
MAKVKKDKTHCIGCTENFYNGNNPYDIKECWNFKSGKMQTRYRICNSTPMTNIYGFLEVVVMSCRHEKGYSLLHEMPRHLQAEWNARLKEQKRTARITRKLEATNGK